MNNDLIQKILSLQAVERLKKRNMLNLDNARKILSDEPAQLAEKLSLIEQVSGMFKSPFEIPNDVDGEIRFAKTENHKPIGININDLLSGLIIGPPRSGKSILTYHIALQAMAQDVICWMFVKDNDAAKLIKFKNDFLVDDFNGQIPINLLPPPPNFPQDNWTSIHWDVFIQSVSLYDGTKNFLTAQYFDLYEKYKEQKAEPSFFEIYDFLKARKFPNFSRDARYNESALNRIGGMIKGSLRKDLDCSSSNLHELVFQNTIFNYKGLSLEASVYFINALIAWLAAYKEVNPMNNKVHLIILDDAMHVFDANRLDRRPDMGIGYINHILFETRKYLIKFLVDVHVPSLISKGILGTSNFKCLMNIPNANEINFMLDILGVHDKAQREYAHKLDSAKREMVVKMPNYPEAFLAKIPESPLARAMDLIEISPEEKFENNRRILKNFSKVIPRIPYSEIIRFKAENAKTNSASVNQSVANPEESSSKFNQAKEVLADIYSRFDVASSQRASDLSLSAQTSNKIYKYLEKEQLVDFIRLNPENKRGGLTKFHLITAKGCEFINKPPIKQSGAGLIHNFIQKYLKKYLPEKGFKELTIEKDIAGKRIDVFGTYNNLKIAIEICISNFKGELSNVQKNRGKCDLIVIVCTDKKAKQRLETELEGKIPDNDRVRICVVHELLNDPEKLICENK